MTHHLSLRILAAAMGCCGPVLSACATPPPRADMVERISFDPISEPFCGRCENTSFVVGADGELKIETGHWEGAYRDWRRRRSTQRVSPEQFAEFKRRLEPYRPLQGAAQRDDTCVTYHHDLPGAVVEWSVGGQRVRRVFDFGCRDDLVMIEAVRGAPSILGF